MQMNKKSESKTLKAADILQWEFEYARTTASEAMRDRHTMINYYLLAVGIVASGVIAILKKDSGLQAGAGTALLWGLCIIGWFYFLKIIRLRQAWYESAQAMNQIKEVYVDKSQGEDKDIIEAALRWRQATLPQPGKRWTVFHYSAMLIGFLNAVASSIGYVLIKMPSSPKQWECLVSFGVFFFIAHDLLYVFFLKK
ncbi:hypothetical protein IH785_08615 [candidate division KSB1 bacterium]|nr:hypothetical protein [candidate division KSB1 bacterium]